MNKLTNRAERLPMELDLYYEAVVTYAKRVGDHRVPFEQLYEQLLAASATGKSGEEIVGMTAKQFVEQHRKRSEVSWHQPLLEWSLLMAMSGAMMCFIMLWRDMKEPVVNGFELLISIAVVNSFVTIPMLPLYIRAVRTATRTRREVFAGALAGVYTALVLSYSWLSSFIRSVTVDWPLPTPLLLIGVIGGFVALHYGLKKKVF